jgi:nucleoid-associated protein YgaU
MVAIKSIVSKGTGAVKGELEKLTITAYSDADCNKKKPGVDPFKAQFNPNSTSESLKIEYADPSAAGQVDGVKKFQHVNSTELKLSLTLDATGVSGANGTKGSSGTMGLTSDTFSIPDEIKAFKDATVEYDGQKHEVPYVHIVWGKLDFKGRLTQLNINHTMFNSSGVPIRSVIEATFSSAKDLITQAKEKSNASPDLTHVRTVQTGDTLPLMCQTIYDDSAYYLKVARFNNLIDFRNLEPGSEIIFPPVI